MALPLLQDEHIRNFMVTFDLRGTDTCVVVDYGDESPKRAYGSRSQCFTRYRPEQFQFEGDLETPLWLQNIYERGFDYVFTLLAFNDISEQTSVLNFTVNNEPCKPPIIKIRNQVLDPANATVFYRYGAAYKLRRKGIPSFVSSAVCSNDYENFNDRKAIDSPAGCLGLFRGTFSCDDCI